MSKRYARKRPPFTPAEEQRFEERTIVERVYSRLKDEFGALHSRVWGRRKTAPNHSRFRSPEARSEPL